MTILIIVIICIIFFYINSVVSIKITTKFMSIPFGSSNNSLIKFSNDFLFDSSFCNILKYLFFKSSSKL